MYSLLAVFLGLGLSVYFLAFTPLVIFAFFTLVLLALARFACVKVSRRILRVACYFCLGAALGYWQTDTVINAQLPKSEDGRTFTLTVKILSLPEVKTRSTSFQAKVIAVNDQDNADFLQGKRIKLSWYYPRSKLAPGQTWQLDAKLRRPRGFVNPYSFDYQAWLLGQGISATGYVKGRDPTLLKEDSSVNGARMRIADDLEAQELGMSEAFFKALLIGDKSDISAQQWSVLQRTGTIHLMAISGLHIGLLAFWGLLLGKACARVYALITESYAAHVWHYLPILFSICFALCYAALAGFTIPTQRALLACVAVNLGLLAGLKLKPLDTLLLIAVVVLLLQPFAFLDQGFCLSFAAVAVLLFCLSGRRLKGSQTLLKSQWVLFVGLSLPLLLLGQSASGVSGLANLVAVPCISILIVPGLMISAVLQAIHLEGLAQYLLLLLSHCFEALWWGLEFLSQLPQLQWWPSVALSGFALATTAFGIVLLLLPNGLQFRILGVILLVPILATNLAERHHGDIGLTVMDVGQGLALVVDTGQETWLYDTGPKYSDDFDAGSRIVAPYLRKKGVRQVSVIAGHGDVDHNGGLNGILQNLEVKRILHGEALPSLNPSMDSEPFARTSEPCEAGQRWHSGELHFEILWPPKNHPYEGNNASCVLLITLQTIKGRWRVLIPGDIEAAVEQRILHRLPEGIDVLISPHHGSRSSSSPEFLQRLAPNMVVVSAGFNNRYGHPHSNVVSRYEALGAKVLNTAEQGAVVFSLNDGEIEVKTARQNWRRRWFD